MLILLSGSLSIVGFIFYGAYWIAINENIYLGIIVGMFFFQRTNVGFGPIDNVSFRTGTK